MKLILTPEQKVLQQHAHRMSIAGQAERLSVAISRALNAASEDIAAEGGAPSLEAVLQALAGGAAYYCCQVENKAQRDQLVELVETSLNSQVLSIIGSKANA